MRSPLLLSVPIFALAATAWAEPQFQEPQIYASPGAEFWIAPGEITEYRGNPGLISGTFTLKKSLDSPRPALTTGGACLVYQNEPKPCADDGVCNTDGKIGYCITDRSTLAGMPSTTSCWYRPSPDPEVSCQKSPTLDLVQNVAYQTPLVSAYYPTRPIWWRVLTCQNIADLGCGNGTDEDHILNAGPIWSSDGPSNPGQFHPSH